MALFKYVKQPAPSVDVKRYVSNEFSKIEKSIDSLLRRYPQSASERAEGIIPADTDFIWGNVHRYGAVGNGTAVDTVAFQTAANSGHVVSLEKGFVYRVGAITLTKNFILDGNYATIKSDVASGGPGIQFAVRANISILKVVNIVSEQYSQDADSRWEFINNRAYSVVTQSSFPDGTIYNIDRVFVSDNAFTTGRITIYGPGVFNVSKNYWYHATATIRPALIMYATAFDATFVPVPGSVIEDNHIDILVPDGDNEDIIKISGAKASVFTNKNFVRNRNLDGMGQIDCYTGFQDSKITNNTLVNVQVHRKEQGSVDEPNTGEYGYDIISDNSFLFEDGFSLAPVAIYYRGSLSSIVGNTIRILADTLEGKAIYLDNEGEQYDARDTDAASAVIISTNLIDIRSAHVDTVHIGYDGDSIGADEGRGVSVTGNIFLGGERIIENGRDNCLLMANIWLSTANTGGNALNIAGVRGLALGNICSSEATPTVFSPFSRLNIGFTRSLTQLTAAVTVTAQQGDIFLLNGTGDVTLNDGNVGDEVTFICNGGAPQFVHGTTVKLDGAINYTMVGRDVITFIWAASAWQEKYRSAEAAAATSGVYTPTLTNVANLDASTAYECQYLRVGSTVHVSGRVDVDPTVTATSTQLGISLPIASSLGAASDCAGAAFATGIAGQGAGIFADSANDRAEMRWVSADVTNQAMYFSFSYQIL